MTVNMEEENLDINVFFDVLLPIRQDKICRFCLTQDGNLYPIFQSVGEVQSYDLDKILTQLSILKFTKDDGLPCQLCEKCVKRSRETYDFQDVVQRSHTILQHYMTIPDAYIYSNVPTSTESSACPEPFFKEDDAKSEPESIKSTESTVILQETIKKPKRRKKSAFYKRKRKVIVKTDTLYSCRVCKQEFNSRSDLKQHNLICVKSAKYQVNKGTAGQQTCHQCCKEFSTVSECKMHIQMFHPSVSVAKIEIEDPCVDLESDNLLNSIKDCVSTRKLRHKSSQKENDVTDLDNQKLAVKGWNHCELCGAIFKTDDELKKHIEHHRNEKDTVCVICTESFENLTDLLKHVKRQHTLKPYACKSCSSSFANEQSLIVHIRCKHTREKALSCPMCPKKYVEVRGLNRHKESHFASFMCSICDKSFKFKQSLTAHVKAHSRKEDVHCNQCSQTFKDSNQLKRHIRVAHTGESHPCLECPKVFSHESRLRKHLLCHLGEELRPLVCAHCPKRFNFAHHLHNHERIHTGLRPYLCSECGRGFTQLYNLTIHQRQHDVVQPYPCKICNKTFAQSQRLERHLLIHSGERSFMCNLCGKCYSDNTSLKRHIKSHKVKKEDEKKCTDSDTAEVATEKEPDSENVEEPEKSAAEETGVKTENITCRMCRETFSSYLNLRIHMKKHTSKYMCNICSRSFSLPNILQMHLLTHNSGQRRYGCSECDVRYTRPEHLRAHVRRAHSKERTHFCPQCPSSFFQGSELNVHMRRHTGERPFVCSYCKKGFAASTALTIHKRTHTGEKPYKCQICSRGFTTSSSLLGHTRTHSNEQRQEANMDSVRKIYSITHANQKKNENTCEVLETVGKMISVSDKNDLEALQLESEPQLKNITVINTLKAIDYENINSFSVRQNFNNRKIVVPEKNVYLDSNNDASELIDTVNIETSEYDNMNVGTNLEIPSSEEINLNGNIRIAVKSNDLNMPNSSFNIIQSADGKLTLQLPENIQLVDQNFKINDNIDESMHVLKVRNEQGGDSGHCDGLNIVNTEFLNPTEMAKYMERSGFVSMDSKLVQLKSLKILEEPMQVAQSSNSNDLSNKDPSQDGMCLSPSTGLSYTTSSDSILDIVPTPDQTI